MVPLVQAPRARTSWAVKFYESVRKLVSIDKLRLTQTGLAASANIEFGSEPVIIVDSTAGPVVVTLFASATAPNDGQIYRYWVNHIAGDNPVTVQIAGGETFADGLLHYLLPFGKTIQLGVLNGGGWLRIGDALEVLRVGREAAWAAGNFVAATAVPFDTLYRNDNDAVQDINLLGAPTDVVINYRSRYQLAWSAGQTTGRHHRRRGRPSRGTS